MKTETQNITYLELARIYLKMGANAYGGWSTTYLLAEKEFSVERQLLTKEQLKTAMASGQALPGPAQVIVAAQTSYFIKGTLGSCIATLCYLLPSLVLTLLFCFVYFNYLAEKDVAKYTIGIQAAVGGIIIGNAYKIARYSARSVAAWVAAIGVGIIYFVFRPSVLVILVVFGILGIVLDMYRGKHSA